MKSRFPFSVRNETSMGAFREAPWYESKDFLYYFHPAPIINGHSMIIPKSRKGCLTQLTSSERLDLVRSFPAAVRALAARIGNEIDDDEISYVTAYQTKLRTHDPVEIAQLFYIHLVPRTAGDKYITDDDPLYMDLYENTGKTPSLLSTNITETAPMVIMKNRPPQCVFCNNQNTNAGLIFETESFRLVYEKEPVLNGHVLLVSNRCIGSLHQLTTKEAMEMLSIFDTLIPSLLAIYQTDAYDAKIKSGPYSGRKQAHFHIHLLPRPIASTGGYVEYYIDKEKLRESNNPEQIKEEINRLRARLRSMVA